MPETTPNQLYFGDNLPIMRERFRLLLAFYILQQVQENQKMLKANGTTGVEALAVVVGNFVAEPQERQAADWAVAIIQVAEPEEELAAGLEGV